jgi:hypothetical protein
MKMRGSNPPTALKASRRNSVAAPLTQPVSSETGS